MVFVYDCKSYSIDLHQRLGSKMRVSIFPVGQHSWLFTESNPCVEVSFADTSSETDRPFVQSSLSRKYKDFIDIHLTNLIEH